MNNTWIKTSDRLPEEGKYVLAIYNGANWKDSQDPVGCYCVIVKLARGISMEERANLSDDSERKCVYTSADQEGNNRVPYRWITFGPSKFFGQDIDYWQPLPEPPV